MNPLSERCPSLSKRTGRPCQQWVIGGGVCFHHGGNAPQVKAKREARIVVAEAQSAAARRGEQWAPRHPGEVLLSAVAASDELSAALLTAYRTGEVTPAVVRALGEAIDRSARTAKTALDAGVEERMAQVREAPTRELLEQVVAAVSFALHDASVPAVHVVAIADRFLEAAAQLTAGTMQPVKTDAFLSWVENLRHRAELEAAQAEQARSDGAARDAALAAAVASGAVKTLVRRTE